MCASSAPTRSQRWNVMPLAAGRVQGCCRRPRGATRRTLADVAGRDRPGGCEATVGPA